MATTYNYISRNKIWSLMLMLGFIALIAFIGWFIGYEIESGPIGVIMAFLFSVFVVTAGYYGGDKIALFTSGAKGPIEKTGNEYYWNMVENLSIATGTPMPKLYLIDDPSINALATGRDPKHASIAVTTGALTKLENEELEGVLAHELSHIRNYDVRYMMLVLILVNLIVLLARWVFWGSRGRSRDRGSQGNIFAIAGVILLILSPIIAQILRFAVSRRREFLADASGALITRYPEGLARALEKIRNDNVEPLHSANDATAHLFFANPFGRGVKNISRMFSTHPPIEERIAALRAMAGDQNR